MNNSRKQYFIDKSFQTQFILKFCSVVIVSSIVIAFATIIFSQNSTTVAIENTRVVVKNTSDFILPLLSSVLIVVAIFSSIIVAAISLFVSHKISGPLFRIKREIDLLSEGDLKRNFNLRSKDQLQELAKSLAKLTKVWRDNRADINKKASKIKEYLKEKNFTLKSDDREYFSDLMSDLQTAIDAFKS